MKLREAISRLRFTVSKGNKCGIADTEAFNMICEHLQISEEKTIQDNLLFAKLYTHLLEKLSLHFNNVDEANKHINKLLSEPMTYRIEMLHMHLRMIEVTQVFADPFLKDQSQEELQHTIKNYPKFQKEFETCWDYWDKDNVISHLNANINLSIQNFKNHV